MKTDTIVDNDYFDGVDWDTPSIEHPMIKQLQTNARQSQLQVLDEDIITWGSKQDKKTRLAINNVIRQFIELQTV